VLLDDAGLEVARRHHHADALHVREEPEQRGLVGHSVLQRHHGRARRERRDEVLHGRLRLVALDREQHGGGTGEVGLGRAAHGGYVDRALAVRGCHGQTVRPDRREVGAAGHQRDVEPRVVHPGAEDAADRSRAVNQPVHGRQPRSTHPVST
jgi:hypothetical protein